MRRRRLTPEERRNELLDIGAEFFATRPYDEVLMEDVAERAGVSRALLYRYFPGKRELFAAIYRHAAEQLLDLSRLDPAVPLEEAASAGLDAHIDYFAANRCTMLTANRTLCGDPVIQAIINDELCALRARMLDACGFAGHQRDVASATLHAWLVFVRVMCLEWLENQNINRSEVHSVCLRTLLTALAATEDCDTKLVTQPLERKIMTEFKADEIAAFNKLIIEDFRKNNGSVTVEPFAGGQLLLLHHVGAKSGVERVSPLGYTLDGDDVIIIASKGGTPENPAWFHNLVAHPETTIELGPDTIEVTAEALTEGPERERLFTQMANVYSNFYEYQKKTDRLIPVVVLHRR